MAMLLMDSGKRFHREGLTDGPLHAALLGSISPGGDRKMVEDIWFSGFLVTSVAAFDQVIASVNVGFTYLIEGSGKKWK